MIPRLGSAKLFWRSTSRPSNISPAAWAHRRHEARARSLRIARFSPEFIERFGLGYSPTRGLLKALNPTDPLRSGLFQKNDSGEIYDRFRRRLMFPIWNERGKVIAFGGRIIGEGQPKYLNSPESALYSKSFVLYGLHLAKSEARKAGRMVVVEGYFECLSLHQNGIENVVASCGTSLTAQQVGILTRYVPEVIVNYDPDAAGQSAATRSIQLLLERGLTVRVLTLPDGMDPDDFVRKEGPEAYRRQVDQAPYFWEFLIARAQAEADLSRPEVKSRVLGEILGYVATISDRVVQLEITRVVAEKLNLPPDLILDQLKAGRKPTVRTDSRVQKENSGGGTRKQKLTLAEKQIIQAVLQDPGVAASLEPFAGGEFLSGIWAGRLIEKLIREPGVNIEEVLDGLGDVELEQEVRAAALEPFGKISSEVAVVSMGATLSGSPCQNRERDSPAIAILQVWGSTTGTGATANGDCHGEITSQGHAAIKSPES